MDHIAYNDRFGHLVFSGNPTFLSLCVLFKYFCHFFPSHHESRRSREFLDSYSWVCFKSNCCANTVLFSEEILDIFIIKFDFSTGMFFVSLGGSRFKL